ncbi:sensor histidine kinase [Patulibacter sp. NPDC049589]|uniref:sensor histidine kinase n=1 Tax=Patulibacter sp. NPDC049589 TaxID=3154731 RepID=UPI0034281D3F
MQRDQTDTRLDELRRFQEPGLNALPLALLFSLSLLLVSTVLAAATDDPSDRRLAAELGLSAVTACWLLLGRGLPAARFEEGGAWGTAFFVVLIVLMAALVALSPLYGFFSWTGYLFVARAARRPRYLLAVAPVAAISAWSQTGGTAGDSVGSFVVWVVLAILNTAVAGTVIWFSWNAHEQDEHRREALDDLTVAHRELERTTAENAALHERLVEQARAAGVEEERGRMAREIHDTLAQGLVGIVTQLEAAEQAADRGGDWRRHHHNAAAMAREGLVEARRSVHALRPEPLEDARLPDAVADVAREWSARHAVPVEVTTTGDARPLRPEYEVTLLRTAQEALANVARHASAGRVGLTLSYMGDQVTLDVRDDGVGFDPAACAREAAARGPADAGTTGGYGLIAMRERVAGLDGTLEIESESGGGVALSATVPARLAGGDA